MVLALALVDAETEISTYHPELGHILPEIPLHKAREVSGIANFFGHAYNIFSSDNDPCGLHSLIRPYQSLHNHFERASSCRFGSHAACFSNDMLRTWLPRTSRGYTAAD